MEAIFLKILNMSITATWLVLAVFVLRLLLKRAPRYISVILWAMVGVRLICPFSFESVLSLIPSAETVPPSIIYSDTPAIESGVPIINHTINQVITENLAPTPEASVSPMQIIAFIATVVWILGVLVMIFYTVFSYLRIERKVREAVQYEGNVWLCDHVDTPFILGIVRPRIYLPSNISKQDMDYVIAHEKAHIKRRDHLWKPLGFLILAVYWFNPALWFAYVLLCKDIEFACDEKVLKQMGSEIKKPYSDALINCSVPRKMISACPLAFGEVGVKGRIKSVLNYKKPAFWIVLVAVITSIAVALCFLTNPKKKLNNNSLKNPPELSVSCGKSSVTAWEGGYSWKYTNPHTGEGTAVYADDFHPLKVIDSVPKLEIAPSVVSSEKPRVASLQFTIEPDKIDVKCYKLDEQNVNNSEAISVQGTSFKMKEGYYLYEIIAWWSSSDVYSGSVTYAFQTTDRDFVAQNSTSSTTSQPQNDALSKYTAWYSQGADSGLSLSSINALKERFPQFFNLKTDGGITVYIWQTSENNYRCFLMNTNTAAKTDQSFAFSSGTTIAETRAILSTYDIDKADITVTPVKNPLFSYDYKIDSKYEEKVRDLFWQSDKVLYTMTSAVSVLDDDELTETALNSDKLLSNNPPYHLPVHKLDTLKDLNDFKDSLNDKIVADRVVYANITSFNDATKGLDAEFFKTHSLMVIYHSAGSGSWRYDVHSIEYTNKAFKIHVVNTYMPGLDGTMNIAEWFITVAVPKSLIKNCTEFDADINNVTVKPNIDELKLKYPTYFNLDTKGGLDVYLWYTSREHVYGGILPTRLSGYTDTELEALAQSSASIDELRAILGYYVANGYIAKDKVNVKLIALPHTEFNNIAESTRQYLENLLWSDHKFAGT